MSVAYAGEFVNDLITILKTKTNMGKYTFYPVKDQFMEPIHTLEA